MASTDTTFVPAWFCPDADLTLRWGRLHGAVYGWQLRYRGRLIDSLIGFPIGAPANTHREALAWAGDITGPRKWIQRPAGSGEHHTHPQPGTTCPPPTCVAEETT